MPNRQPSGGPYVEVTTSVSQSTASRKLPHGWAYLVLIQGQDGFSVVFDGRDEPKAAVLGAVYGHRFRQRLDTMATLLGQSLYVEVIGYDPKAGLKELDHFALRHEGPAILVMQATYNEGALKRVLSHVASA